MVFASHSTQNNQNRKQQNGSLWWRALRLTLPSQSNKHWCKKCINLSGHKFLLVFPYKYMAGRWREEGMDGEWGGDGVLCPLSGRKEGGYRSGDGRMGKNWWGHRWWNERGRRGSEEMVVVVEKNGKYRWRWWWLKECWIFDVMVVMILVELASEWVKWNERPRSGNTSVGEMDGEKRVLTTGTVVVKVGE